MSNYSLNQIKTYAHDSIQNIIPLDDESINEMVQYALSTFKTRASMSNHFLDLLGPSDHTFQFVNKFGDMLFGKEKAISNTNEKEPKVSIKKDASHIKVIPDSPKNGVKKSLESVKKNVSSTKPKSTGVRLVKKQPAASKGRMAGNTSKGTTTSDLFNMKPTTVEAEKIRKKSVKKKLESIEDLDEVLMQLEISGSRDRNSNDIRVCNCNATRHKLFEMYPNCLNCGKIICEKEGLQPCSFCGKSLMTDEERREMLDVVNQEKEDLEKEALAEETGSKKNVVKPKKKNVIKISLNTPGQNNFKVQEQLYKQIEEMNKGKQELEEAKKQQTELMKKNEEELRYYKSRHNKDEELIKAEERLAMLLSFQDNGAERTKIIDHAADFDAPIGGENGGSLWASPMERVLQFKRQQKLQKRMHDQELQRSGRGVTVINVDIKNGKAVYQNVDTSETLGSALDTLSDDDELVALQDQVNKEKLNQFHQETQNVYDFEGFEKTFVKPIYKGDGIKEGDTESISMNNMLAALPKLGTVVQPGDAQEQEDRFLTMAGV